MNTEQISKNIFKYKRNHVSGFFCIANLLEVGKKIHSF